MTNEELVQSIQKLQPGTTKKKLLSELWKQNQGIIYKYAQRYSNALSVPLDDVMQECYITMLQAVKYYDSNKPYKFTTYLSQTIKSVPTTLISKNDDNNATLSLNISVGEDTKTELIELIKDSTALERIQAIDNIELYTYMENILNSGEMEVILNYYIYEYTLQQVASRLNISTDKVRSIRTKALKKLRNNPIIKSFD